MKFENFARILHEDCLLDFSKPIVLGFSGGPDSLALLHALHQEGLNLLVAHLDHALRPESAQEASQAGAIAQGYGYPFSSERADVRSFAVQQSMSIEEAARDLRYAFLFRVARENSAQAVAVAHNADDQVETVLMHLLRGAGPRGLRGMALRSLLNPWSQTIPLVRPLLTIWRQEILEFCQVNTLNPLTDISNEDVTYFRNRLRHELLPQLEEISPGIKKRLHQTADLLQAEAELVERSAKQAWKRSLSGRSKEYIRLNRQVILKEPLALQRYIFRRAAEELRPDLRDLDYDAIHRAIRSARHPVTTPQDWLAGLYLLTEEENLWIADWEADLPVDWPEATAAEIHIEAPTVVNLNHNWLLELRADPDVQHALSNTDPFQAWLDFENVGEELILRRRRPGDRFQPLGLESGSQRLADFMINEKMPKRAREAWPLICKNDEIVWVPGYRLAHPYRLRSDSQRAMYLRLVRSNGSSG